MQMVMKYIFLLLYKSYRNWVMQCCKFLIFKDVFILSVLVMNLSWGSSGNVIIFSWKKQCRSYFMFHGLDVNNPQSVFKYLPILSFTESYIYQVLLLKFAITFLLTASISHWVNSNNFLFQLDASNEDSLDPFSDDSSSSKVRLGHLICYLLK